jgi:acyl-CoA reductase-like NAD-dependent aldehyde dehydrogenase
MQRHGNFIGGAWVMGPDAPNLNPSDTTDIVGLYVSGSAADTADTITAARCAFPAWSRSGLQQRHDILQAVSVELFVRSDELGHLLAREEGKTLADGIGEVARASQIFSFFAGEVLRPGGEKLTSLRSGVEIDITREPLGVVGFITPWNFPMAIPAWKIAPALAFGNCVVFKPAELVPGSAWALAEILSRSGLPQGAFKPRHGAWRRRG